MSDDAFLPAMRKKLTERTALDDPWPLDVDECYALLVIAERLAEVKRQLADAEQCNTGLVIAFDDALEEMQRFGRMMDALLDWQRRALESCAFAGHDGSDSDCPVCSLISEAGSMLSGKEIENE